MKKIFFLIASLIASPCFAAYAGFYIGAQAGGSNTHYKATNINGVTSAKIDNTGLGGRIFGGYQWNANWAAEVGYTRYTNTQFRNINATGTNGSITENATDLVGKFIIPFNCKLGAYGKVGVAHIDANKESHLLGGDKTEYCPTYGVGFSYDINPNVPIEISWSRVYQVSSIADADLFAIGISYHFG